MPQNSTSTHNSDLVIATKSQDNVREITPYNLTEETHLVARNSEKNLHVIPKSQVTEETIVIPVRFQDGTLITEIIKEFGADPKKHPYSNLLRDNVTNVCTLKSLTTKNLLDKDIPIEFIEWCRGQGVPIADVRSSTTITRSRSSTKTETEISSGSTRLSASESVSLNEPPPMVEVKQKITKKEKPSHHLSKDHHSMLKAKYFNPTWWMKKIRENEISLRAENNDAEGEIVVKFGRREFAIHTYHKHAHPSTTHTVEHTQQPQVRQLEHHLYEGHEYDEEGHPVRLNFKGLPNQIQHLLYSTLQGADETTNRVARDQLELQRQGEQAGLHTVHRAGEQRGDLLTKQRIKIHRMNDDDQTKVRDTFESRKVTQI